MSRKRSKGIKIEGDVNVTNGDVVAGDKTVIQGNDKDIPASKSSLINKRKKAKGLDLMGGNLEVSGGDVVFGDKIIKFIQDNLNVYLFKDIKQLAFFLSVIIVVSAGVIGGIWYSKQPQKMIGNFNIVVAQFGEIMEDGSIKPSANAEKISSTLFNFLDSEYRASGLGLTVQIAHKNMPLIIEETQAEELAKRVNADIVIFGNIFVRGDQAEFSPRFYVAEQSDTKELTGQNELAYPITFFISELTTQNKVNVDLRIRAEILFNFTKGLIYFSQKDTDLALRSAQAAIIAAEKLSQPFDGEETLYLLAAQIQLRRGDFDKANQMIDQALTINPEYARAHLARGNIYYSQALQENFDVGLLNNSLTEYEMAYQMPNQPEGAYIPIKARTNLGNVLVVRAQQTNNIDLYNQAIENYTYVIEEYQQTQDPFILKYAAISYFGLGAAYERQGNKREALAEYQHALELTDDQEFRSRIEQQIKSLQNQ